MKKFVLHFVCAMTLILSNSALAAQYFASPTGNANATGTLTDPWDLETALLNYNTVGAGDTLYLRGGTYYGRFESWLSGSASARVLIRPYNNETPIIDGNIVYTIDPISSTDTTIDIYGENFFAFGNNGSTITVHSSSGIESIELGIPVQASSTHRRYVNCVRGTHSTTPLSHSGSTEVYLGGVSTLRVLGSHSVIKGLIVQNSNPIRSVNLSGSFSQYRGNGIDIEGQNTVVANNVVKDNGVGIGFWQTAIDSEIYGNVIFNNGWTGPDRSHGHGIYTQNMESTGRKLIRQNLVFNNFRIGMNVYGSSNVYANNYDIEENVIANNGVASTFPGNSAGNTSDYREWGVLIGTGNRANSVYVTGNHFYINEDIDRGQHIQAGYITQGNSDFKFINNVVVGGKAGLHLNDWDLAEVRDNLIATNSKGVHIVKAGLNPTPPYTSPFILDNHNFENNEYIQIRPGTDSRYFTLTDVGYYPFHNPTTALDSWIELIHNSASNNTFEAGSTYEHDSLDIRMSEIFQNENRSGLYYIVVYNSVDDIIKFDYEQFWLANGESFRIIDLQSGHVVYQGIRPAEKESFTLVLKDCGATHPIGLESSNYMESMAPNFGVYALEKLNSWSYSYPDNGGAIYTTWAQGSCSGKDEFSAEK